MKRWSQQRADSDWLRLVVRFNKEDMVSGLVARLKGDKDAQYECLIRECKANGWRTVVYAVEVGASGYVAVSLKSCFFSLCCKGS